MKTLVKEAEQAVGPTQSVPWTANFGYPSTVVMSLWNSAPVSSTVQFAGGGEEKVYPGSDATTTWNEMFFPDVVPAVRGRMTGMNSWKEPRGQMTLVRKDGEIVG
jgi:hypothetical protein